VRTKRVPLTPEQAHAILPAVEGDRVEALHLIRPRSDCDSATGYGVAGRISAS
jgi:hypothetical protein